MDVTLRDPAIPDVADVPSFWQGYEHALQAIRAVCVEQRDKAQRYALIQASRTSEAFMEGNTQSFQEIIDLIDSSKGEHHGN